MDYFDATKPPKGLLRIRFETASQDATGDIAVMFYPVFNKLVDKATRDKKLRIGFDSEKRRQGKSTLAIRFRKLTFRDFSNDIYVWIGSKKDSSRSPESKSVYHYDSVNVRKQSSPTKSTERAAETAERNRKQIARAKDESEIHLSEWIKEDDDTNVSCLWSFSQHSQNESHLIDLFCTDEIFAMPEYREFTRNVKDFIIKTEGKVLSIEEFSPLPPCASC